MNKLDQIIEKKYEEVALLKQKLKVHPDPELTALLIGEKARESTKSFKQSLLVDDFAVIAEIKRRSPSKPHIGDIADPCALAKAYLHGGANAISVLTDETFFGGSLTDLKKIAKLVRATPQTILRKDFVIDPIQIAEAIAAGADAILLIVKVLKKDTAKLLQVAKEMNIEALVEINNAEELKMALEAGADLIGINNRDLDTFVVDVQTSIDLRSQMPANIVAVAASGVDSAHTAHTLKTAGFHAILVGEALVRSDDPAQLIAQFKEKK